MKKIVPLVILAGIFNFSLSQDKYSDIKNIESICYCNTTESTPDAILKLDNNWEIIRALMSPKTASQLDSAGLKYTSSQLKLLEHWSIISRSDDDKYQTMILVLDSIKTTQLRQFSLSSSMKLTAIISEYVIKLKNSLKKINREANVYTVLFSYVLDGMVWDYLDADSLMQAYEINAKRPFWAGEFWLVYPKRDFSCGTNSISDKGYSIKVNWSERAIPKMAPFVTRWDLLSKILIDLILKNKVEDIEAKDIFGPYNFFDNNGIFTVPVIIENDSNLIYNLSRDISAKVSKFLMNNVDLEFLRKEFMFRDNSQAIIVLYHEMLWDMMDVLEEKGLVVRPKMFSDPENSKASDVSDLIIITKK